MYCSLLQVDGQKTQNKETYMKNWMDTDKTLIHTFTTSHLNENMNSNP